MSENDYFNEDTSMKQNITLSLDKDLIKKAKDIGCAAADLDQPHAR